MRILINRSDAIGDTLLTLPLAQIIKEHYPQAKVYFLINQLTAPLFENHPYVDGTIILSLPKKIFSIHSLYYFLHSLRNALLEYKIDHYLYVGGSHFPTLVARTLPLTLVGGHQNSFLGFVLLKTGMRQRRSKVKLHEALYNIKLLELIDIYFKENELHELKNKKFMPLYLDNQVVTQVNNQEIDFALSHVRPLTLKHGDDGDSKNHQFIWKDNYIIIHPGMRGHTLNWPAENYFYLVKKLILEEEKMKDFAFIFSYTSGDMPYIQPIWNAINATLDTLPTSTKKLREHIFFLNGEEIGLRAYLRLLQRAKFFVGPSTGTTHLANALGVDLIALYSPIKVQSAKRWGPFFTNSHFQVLTPPVSCAAHFYCIHSKCKNYPCMHKIKVETVAQKVLQAVIRCL
ncbi:MAG: glycosyltransferase family 9 protein [Oligoflexia bacterium]|nr:glycosyltransferase family 9 protein [Oligoflexia bacterium]